jgi:hypothetical protein
MHWHRRPPRYFPSNVFPLKLTSTAADDILVVIIAQGLMAIAYGGRKPFIYFYFLPTAIMSLSIFPTRPLSASTRKGKSKKRFKKGKKSVSVEDPSDEKLASPSPPPMTTPTTPSLIVSKTILGILFSFSSTLQTHN